MNKRTKKALPAIVQGTKDFRPTGLQIKWMVAYLEDEANTHPAKLLEDLGAERTGWYRWRDSAAFVQWLTVTVQEWLGSVGLANVQKAIYRRAVRDSSADAKLFLERFDSDYKPTTKQEIDVQAHQLNRPDAIERSQQRIANLKPDSGQAQADSLFR